MLDVDFVGETPDFPSRKFAVRSRFFDFGGYGATAANFSLGMRHRKSRDLAGNGPALRLVGIEDGRWRPAIEMRGNQPGQVHGVGNSSIHAVAGVGNPDVRGIAGDKCTAVAKLVGNQAPSVPILPRYNVVLEIQTDAEDRPDARIAINGIEIHLIRLQVIMHQPSLAAINGVHHAGAARVYDAGAPCTLVSLAIDQVRSADESRLHALHDGVAGQFGANGLADDGARPVATEEKAATQAPDFAGF